MNHFKVLIINGHNHKGSTYHTARMLADKITSDENITEMFLPRDLDGFCAGCAQCVINSETVCPKYEQVNKIERAMDENDVIILSSPVFVFHCSGSMKNMLDHFAYRWIIHRPSKLWWNKQFVAVTTAAGGGIHSTLKDMTHSFKFWCVGKYYKFGFPVAATSWEQVNEKKRKKIDKKTTKTARKILRNGKVCSTRLFSKIMFYVSRIAQKSGWNKADSDYWKENGWLEKIRPWKTQK